MMQRAVFFDRDGTLIVDKHYMHKIEEIEYYEDSFSALKRLVTQNYKLFIVTNQSGIKRGIFTEEQMHKVHMQMLKDYSLKGINIQGIEFCPHTPEDNCICRKPEPKMLENIAHKYNIDLSKSFMVGDKLSDAQAGERAGAQGILLRLKNTRYKSFDSLSEVTDFILN